MPLPSELDILLALLVFVRRNSLMLCSQSSTHPYPYSPSPEPGPTYANGSFTDSHRENREPVASTKLNQPRHHTLGKHPSHSSFDRSFDRPQEFYRPQEFSHPQDFSRPRFPGNFNNGSGPDSLIDLYHNQKNGHRPASPEPGTMEGNELQREDTESDQWVHRDKLVAIEIQEYKDRGMEPPQELLERAGMKEDSKRSKKGRHSSKERTSNESKRQKLQSSTPPIDSVDEELPYVPEDPRSPEEIAENPYEDLPQPAFHMHVRSSSSRIPVATSSPVPIPIEHIERSTPLPRKRTSNDWADESFLYNKVRSRANSVGSQVLLGDEGLESTPASPQSSPSKVKTTHKARTPSAPLKITNPRQRTPSANKDSPSARPNTRTGLNDRPRTAVNRPEGPPPWLDTMYQPDPSLPPDQQMLPTHAKRMMKERMEKEGKLGSAYDRDFSPIVPFPESQSKAPTKDQQPLPVLKTQEDKDAIKGKEKEQAQPLKPPGLISEAPRSPSYTTMPKVQSSPAIGALPSPMVQRPQQPIEVETEEVKKSKGCGCCLVM